MTPAKSVTTGITSISTASAEGGASGKETVMNVLNSLFGESVAANARFLTAADGVTQLVDLTAIPHQDFGWQVGITFQTTQGEMSMQDVRDSLSQAQEAAGVADPVLVTISVLESV